jgi:hypothetical protein
MATITFSNGTKIKFDGQPTQADIEEIATKLGLHQSEPVEQTEKEPTMGSRVSDVVNKAGASVYSNITGTGENAGQSSIRRGTQAVASTFNAVPQTALAVAPKPVRDIAGKIGEGVGTAFSKLIDLVSDNPALQKWTQDHPDATRAIQEVAGTLSATGQVAGDTLFAQGTANTLTKGKNLSLQAGQKVMGVTKNTLNKLPSVKSLRLQLSNVDPQVETVLKRSNANEVNRYFQQAQTAKANPAKSTPLELAGNKAEEAFNIINKARQDAIQAKKGMLSTVETKPLTNNPAGTTIDKIKADVADKFGVVIKPDGTLGTVQGRIAKLDAPSQKLVSEYVTKLRQMGMQPTAQKVDDFVDWAQGQLYKQSKEVSKLKSADEATVAYLKGVTGELNSNLKGQIGGGYGEVNTRISRLIELQDELSKALGADARKGGGLMKKLFSPTGGDTRRIFEEIQKETGIDLFKEATLAKFAMESVGDVRQKSLLKQLDIAIGETATLDLTKPLSIVKWLREKADLDGQELANQLLKEINASGGSR